VLKLKYFLVFKVLVIFVTTFDVDVEVILLCVVVVVVVTVEILVVVDIVDDAVIVVVVVCACVCDLGKGCVGGNRLFAMSTRVVVSLLWINDLAFLKTTEFSKYFYT
jgi:hypothetical protein